jgi:hypothetical protein
MTDEEIEIYWETIQLLALVKAAYPEFNRDVDQDAVIKLWHGYLAPYGFEACGAAVMQHIQECKFAPKIAEVVQRIAGTETLMLPAGDDLTLAYMNNLKTYKAVTGRDYEPPDCVKEKYGFPKCEGCYGDKQIRLPEPCGANKAQPAAHRGEENEITEAWKL